MFDLRMISWYCLNKQKASRSKWTSLTNKLSWFAWFDLHSLSFIFILNNKIDDDCDEKKGCEHNDREQFKMLNKQTNWWFTFKMSMSTQKSFEGHLTVVCVASVEYFRFSSFWTFEKNSTAAQATSQPTNRATDRPNDQMRRKKSKTNQATDRPTRQVVIHLHSRFVVQSEGELVLQRKKNDCWCDQVVDRCKWSQAHERRERERERGRKENELWRYERWIRKRRIKRSFEMHFSLSFFFFLL